jgi:hypothetical protein
MNIITEAGANGKASGRLKSYKFREGAQQFDITLPVGDSGDFICLVTHSANGLMTDGIGVGLQSDGNENWNLVTLSGTTVTVGALSGLTDGKTARIEIEKDITGAYWYYIYDAAGPKPTTATGKLFTTLSEGYTGWYANGNSKTYAIENISIRAESIVGRTNVEVTEPFWFRDEFGEDSRGRYISPGAIVYDGENNECYTWGRFGIYIADCPTFKGETIVTIQTRNTGVSTDCHPCVVFGEPKKIYYYATEDNFLNGNPTLCVRFSTDGVRVYQNGAVVPGATSTAIKYQSGKIQTFVVTYNGSNQITVSDGTNSITFTDAAFAVRTVFSVFVGPYSGGAGSGIENRFKLIEISGTRVYNKPIHRGAMLETYYDGTREVVGTTFIDDCQWDRSAEYIQANPTSFTFDTVNGGIVETGTVRSDQLKIKTRFGSAHYHYKFTKIADADYIGAFTFCDQSETSHTCPIDNITACPNAELYFVCVHITPSNTYLQLRRRTVGDTATIGSTVIPTISNGETHTIDILHNAESGNIRVFYDGILKINTTDTTYTSGYCGPTQIWSYSTTVKFSEIQIIALDPDATNGIAACIPPIGGGARYGVEESVYNTFTTENVNKGVYLTTAKVKTINPNADEVSLEGTNDTTSITLNTTPIDVDATYTVKTAPITINAKKTDTLRVSVKNSTTCVQSTNYVEFLSLIPVSGDDVLYPQDLAFISSVKPSQKRKVEVK